MSSGKNFFSEAKALFELPFSSAAAIPLPPPSLYLQLVPVKDRELFRAYIFYLFLLLRRGMRRRGLHPKSFNLLYRAVSRTWPGRTLLGFLQKEFIARNLSLSLLLEPLDGFEWLSKNRYPLEFSAASPIWLQVISPFSRLVAVLNNQTPPFYQPWLLFMLPYMYWLFRLLPRHWRGQGYRLMRLVCAAACRCSKRKCCSFLPLRRDFFFG